MSVDGRGCGKPAQPLEAHATSYKIWNQNEVQQYCAQNMCFLLFSGFFFLYCFKAIMNRTQ